MNKRPTLGMALAVTLAIAGTSAAFAQDDAPAETDDIDMGGFEMDPISPADFGLVPHSAEVAGHDRAYWIEKAADWFALTPFDEHYGPQGDCQAAQEGPVFNLSNIPFRMFAIYDCVIEPDKHILISIGGGFGFSDEPGESLETQADFALDHSFSVTDPVLIVDGQRVPVGGSSWYEGPSKVIDLPEGNLFGAPPGEYFSAGNGWYVMLEPLSPGRHTILVGDSTVQPAIKADFGTVADPPERTFETLDAYVAFDIEVPDGEQAAESDEADDMADTEQEAPADE